MLGEKLQLLEVIITTFFDLDFHCTSYLHTGCREVGWTERRRVIDNVTSVMVFRETKTGKANE